MHRLTGLPEYLGSARLERRAWCYAYDYTLRDLGDSEAFLLARITIIHSNGSYSIVAEASRDLRRSLPHEGSFLLYDQCCNAKIVPELLREAHQALRKAVVKWARRFTALESMLGEDTEVEPPSLWDRLDGP
jgi:hypothetical protein